MITRTSCAILTALTVTAAAAEFADHSFEGAHWRDMSPEAAAARVRAALLEWRISPAKEPPPCLSPLATVEGFWVGNSDPAYGCLRLTLRPDGQYDVRFMADGHDGGWRMRRRGTLVSGVLDLSGPLLDYELPPYGRMHAVALGEAMRLVPDTVLGEVAADLEQSRCTSLPESVIGGLLYQPADRRNEDMCTHMLGLQQEVNAAEVGAAEQDVAADGARR